MTHFPDEPPRNLPQWLTYLEQIHSKPIDLGLERVRVVANALGVLPVSGTVFLVAGTNGKGSTVATLESICRAAGYTTATYTSPHLLDYRERVLINGEMLAERLHCEAFSAVESARATTSLTYFEFGTLAALYLIKQHQPDVTILEIGLGGRLDAVNIVDPDVAIVTSIGIDHIEYLGDNRDHIGLEKAGVFRAGKAAICGDASPPDTLVHHAERIGAQLTLINKDFRLLPVHNGEKAQFLSTCVNWENLPLSLLPEPSVACALEAIVRSRLNINSSQVRQGISDSKLPGRFQQIGHSPAIYLDVGHNPHAAKWLAERLQQLNSEGRILAVCGMLSDKDIAGTIKELSHVVDGWYFGTLPGARGTNASVLCSHYEGKAPTYCCDTVCEAIELSVADASSHDTIIVFGSFMTVAEVVQSLDSGRLQLERV